MVSRLSGHSRKNKQILNPGNIYTAIYILIRQVDLGSNIYWERSSQVSKNLSLSLLSFVRRLEKENVYLSIYTYLDLRKQFQSTDLSSCFYLYVVVLNG